jgi:hypothetical protein
MLPLLDEPESPVPGHSARRVLDTENRHDLLVHNPSLTGAASARPVTCAGIGSYRVSIYVTFAETLAALLALTGPEHQRLGERA